MSLHPGQYVLCISTRCLPSPYKPLIKGRVYQIRSLMEWRGREGVRLEGIVNDLYFDGGEFAYDARRFRPIDDSRLDVFRALLTATREPLTLSSLPEPPVRLSLKRN